MAADTDQMGRAQTVVRLKHDRFDSISKISGTIVIRPNLREAAFGLRWFALDRRPRSARCASLAGLNGLPRLLAFADRLDRSYIAGRPMQEAQRATCPTSAPRDSVCWPCIASGSPTTASPRGRTGWCATTGARR
ncbi:MAG: hypothetical protein IPG63_17685 [Xanthomonadales bacterium]|nr:hypothetical protein [Xanthomonadales bacterium]